MKRAHPPSRVPESVRALRTAPAICTALSCAAVCLAGLLAGTADTGGTAGAAAGGSGAGAARAVALFGVALGAGAFAGLFVARVRSQSEQRLRTILRPLRRGPLRDEPHGSEPGIAGPFDPEHLPLRDAVAALRTRQREHLATLHAGLGRAEAREVESGAMLTAVLDELRPSLARLLSESVALRSGARGELSVRQAEGLHIVERGAGELRDLVERLAAPAPLRAAAVDLGALASELLRALGPLVAAERVALRLEVSPGTPPALVDPQAARRILGNLLSNAAKFTAQGEIHVEVWPQRPAGRAAGTPDVLAAPTAVAVRVRDTGPGIPSEELGNLFDEYSQGSASRSGSVTPVSAVSDSGEPHPAGVGLGLFIARRLCEQSGGGITVESEPGRGAAFTVTLPAAEPGGVLSLRRGHSWPGILRPDARGGA